MSAYLELCEILGISLNEFLAGEDIEVTNVEKKSEDTLIQISKDSSHKQRYLKQIIAVLLIAVGAVSYTHLDVYKRQPLSPTLRWMNAAGSILIAASQHTNFHLLARCV